MKYFKVIALLFLCSCLYGQTESHLEKFKELEPDIWLEIWDEESSSKTLNIEKVSYNDIPKYLDFRGTVVEALKWEDALGENILIQTVTGHFKWKDYVEGTDEFMYQDKAELFAYLFIKSKSDSEYKLSWRIYDYTECFGVDWYNGFVPKATTITDLDNNGIAEISIPYVLICRGGMDPGTMKIIMYEGDEKYALRGRTRLLCENATPYGGEFSESDNLKDNLVFQAFLIKHWNSNKCENGKFF